MNNSKENSKIILITGGAGFIGSALIRHLIQNTQHNIINVDKLTYAGNLESLKSVENSPRYRFEKVDICDGEKISQIFEKHQPDIIMHLAAESHVDRSIAAAGEFIQTNIVGTYQLLEVSRKYFENKKDFLFHHISTDEVYGELPHPDEENYHQQKNLFFTEDTPYTPNSPYSSSKASSDHLVYAWYRTYGLPIVITNCSNNYGPYQNTEKLIPLIISNAIQGRKLPVYGEGRQIRDWLYVEDHAKALMVIVENVVLLGKVGETYNIGGNNEKKNIEVVKMICSILEQKLSKNNLTSLIEHVTDRLGHDKRYAIDATKIKNDFGWQPQETFESGLEKTVEWYLKNN